MPSEILERIHEQVAYYERTHPLEDPAERREREFEQRKREAQKACEARKAREAEAASNNWYAAMDGRIHEHLANWLWKAIDERIQEWWKVHSEPLKDGIGGAMGTIGRQVRDEFKRADEEQRRSFETKLAEQQERHDGRIEASLARERDAIGGAQAQLREEVKCAIEQLCDAFGARLAEQKAHFLSVPGKLPVAKLWQPDSVTYEAQVVCHDGSLWQACKDTAQVPGGSDWICVARAGRDGLTPNVRGAFDVYKKYAQLDVVEYEDASYIARRDAPGLCPGDGWQLVSRSGRRGATGEVGPRGRKGERGARGEDGREIVSWHLERASYRAFPIFADGKMGPELNLRPLFEQYCEETSHASE